MKKADTLAFTISRVDTSEDDIYLQLTNSNGDKLEASLGFYVDPFNGDLSVYPYRHFSDPTSVPWFKDSQSWETWAYENGVRIEEGA